MSLSNCAQEYSWLSRRRNRTRCLLQSEHEDIGCSSTPWSTTLPWWAPGSTSSARALKALWTEPSTAPQRGTAKRRQEPRMLGRRWSQLPVTEMGHYPWGSGIIVINKAPVGFWIMGRLYTIVFFSMHRSVWICWDKCTYSPVLKKVLFEGYFQFVLSNVPLFIWMCRVSCLTKVVWHWTPV